MSDNAAASEPVFKAPVLTSAAQRRAEDMAERLDAWRVANREIRESGEWSEPYGPYDVLRLAEFLMTPTT